MRPTATIPRRAPTISDTRTVAIAADPDAEDDRFEHAGPLRVARAAA